MRVAIIGTGLIGSSLYKRLQDLEWGIQFIMDTTGIYEDFNKKVDEPQNYLDYCHDLDLVFLCISTKDDGSQALNYISSFLDNGVPVVTCEKGSLSQYFPELEPRLSSIGYNATVGGGMRMISYIRESMSAGVLELHAVINGGINYIFDLLSASKKIEFAIDDAQNKGYTDSDLVTPLEVIRHEVSNDIPQKVAILFNTANLTPHRIRQSDFEIVPLSEEDLQKLLDEPTKRRYIVSIVPEYNSFDEGLIGGFRHVVDGWVISAGFKNVHEKNFYSQVVPDGVNNGLLLYEGGDGIYTLKGPGAGADATTNAMIKDAINLLCNHKKD